MPAKRSFVVLSCTALALLFLVFLGVRHYGGNVSALLHMDVRFGRQHQVPAGVVLYKDAGYDGMLYYQVARDVPVIFFPTGTLYLDSPYRYQRILLPLIAFVITGGNDRALPFAFLLINLAASLGALALLLSMIRKRTQMLHALTAVLNPAIFVGILFSLTEPLSLFFVVLFLFLWERNHQKMNAATIAVLIFSLLARETTVFLITLLLLWYVFHKQWRQAFFQIVPVVFFAL